MSDVITRHLDAIDAQLALAKAQVDALRFCLAPVPQMRLSVPERCSGVDPARCGVQNDDARQSRASFANRNGWRCVGCGYEE